ncbi:MAG: FACT complex subunit [Watsoniomyces obsoletus]|nr:MAG: FACT complex subunit [Watsoniomyces obsoletus]
MTEPVTDNAPAPVARPPARESFEHIYLDLSKLPGKCRLAENGLGWRPSGGGDTFTLDHTNMASAQWSRAARGYELKIYSRSGEVVQLDGFVEDDMDRLSKCMKVWYGLTLEHKEHALRGWNWGKGDFGKQELAFNVQNRPAFEIPYTEISNTNLAGKNEVAVEFSVPSKEEETAIAGHLAGARPQGKKAGGGVDQLVEMRFYIPGTAKKDVGDDADGSMNGEDQEEENAANVFYNMLMDKAEIGDVAGDTYATFQDVLHLTPRGRFGIDMYEKSFRLRGKTYDYKIQYEAIKKFMLLPKPDDTHTLITIGLDPPLRQGQTRYPFLVMQFKRDEEIDLDLNMTEEMIKAKYDGKLQARYEAPVHQVVAAVFRALSGKKVVQPSKEFESHHHQAGIKCSIKANEGLLYCLDKSFMFVPKPATYIAFETIHGITMSRVGGAISASRTFDITVTLKGNLGEHQFSNINRSEQAPLEAFFEFKELRIKNEMVEDSGALIAAALQDEDMASSDDEVVGARPARGSADEDEESVDEDFQASSESDPEEEYDSGHESSGGDVEMPDADADGGGDANGGANGDAGGDDGDKEEKKRPAKKPKVRK